MAAMRLRAGSVLLVGAALLLCASPAWASHSADENGRQLLQTQLRRDCTPGTFWNVTARRCQNCALGTWSAFQGSLLCEGCASERTCCPAARGPQDCVPINGFCPPVSTCRVKPRGPAECPAGHQWNQFSRECILCPRGFASEGLGAPCEFCEPPTKTCCAGASLCVGKDAPCPPICPLQNAGKTPPAGKKSPPPPAVGR